MPRVHRHVTGSRKYADYTQETLKSACRAVKPGMSLRAAERAYGILMRTISNKVFNNLIAGLSWSKAGLTAHFFGRLSLIGHVSI